MKREPVAHGRDAGPNLRADGELDGAFHHVALGAARD